jgi:hypothetical protein
MSATNSFSELTGMSAGTESAINVLDTLAMVARSAGL